MQYKTKNPIYIQMQEIGVDLKVMSKKFEELIEMGITLSTVIDNGRGYEACKVLTQLIEIQSKLIATFNYIEGFNVNE